MIYNCIRQRKLKIQAEIIDDDDDDDNYRLNIQ